MQMSNHPHVPPSLFLYLFDRKMGGSQVGTNIEEEKAISVLAENRHPILQHAFREVTILTNPSWFSSFLLSFFNLNGGKTVFI